MSGIAFSEQESNFDPHGGSSYEYNDDRTDQFSSPSEQDYEHFYSADLFSELDANVNYDFGSIVADNYGRGANSGLNLFYIKYLLSS